MYRLLPLLLFSLPAFAQERTKPYFHGSLGFAGGQFGFRNDDRSLDDDTAAGLFQLQFEAATRHGIGGGIRFEGYASDDDLFLGNAALPSRASSTSLFGHFTYRLEVQRFAMPVRFGALLNWLGVEQNLTDLQTNYFTISPYLQLEPEFTVVQRGSFGWSFYGQFGIGLGPTAIDIDGDFRDYTSVTGFLAVQAGTRIRNGHTEFGLAYIGRFQSMDESDVESGQIASGYDVDFHGLLFTFGLLF